MGAHTSRSAKSVPYDGKAFHVPAGSTPPNRRRKFSFGTSQGFPSQGQATSATKSDETGQNVPVHGLVIGAKHDLHVAVQHARKVLSFIDSAEADRTGDTALVCAREEMTKLLHLLESTRQSAFRRSIDDSDGIDTSGHDYAPSVSMTTQGGMDISVHSMNGSEDSNHSLLGLAGYRPGKDRSPSPAPRASIAMGSPGGSSVGSAESRENRRRRISTILDNVYDEEISYDPEPDEYVSDWLNDVMYGANNRADIDDSVLCIAAASNDVERIEQLVLGKGLNCDKGDYDCRTALHIAASEGFLGMVKCLVAVLGAATSPIDRWGNTPLDDAVRSEHSDVVSFLKEVGAKRGKGPSGNTDPTVDLLNLTAKGDAVAIKLLFENCEDNALNVDASDYDKRTAVHIAASEGQLQVIRLLIDELGASTSPVDRWGGTPLDDAIRSGYDEVKEYLQSKGAACGATGAYRLGDGAADPSADLCHAAATGNVAALRELISVDGLDVNKGDYDKRTAIHLASSEGLLNVVVTLVEDLGADHSPIDRWGGTPLDDAIRSRAERVASYLRSHGGVRGGLPQSQMRDTDLGKIDFLPLSPSPLTTGYNLWVCPEEMKKVFNQDLFAEELPDSMLAATEMAKLALDSFDGDMISLHAQSDGHALLVMALVLLDHHNLFEELQLDRATMTRFLRAIEAGYGQNTYHNSMHGADVALSVHLFFHKFGLLERLSKSEIFAAIIGAIIHDFNHPGTTNAHESRALTERAVCHSDISTLEAHHLHSTFTLLRQPGLNIFKAMKPEDRAECRGLIIGLVLATDLAKHLDFVKWLRDLANDKGFAKAQSHGEEDDWKTPLYDSKAIDVPKLLTVAVKWADLGHVCKDNALHRTWTAMITEEFYTLGDRERALGLHPSPLCNRATDTDIPVSQLGFFKFLCVPFFALVADLVDPRMTPWLRLKDNYRAWKKEKAQNEQPQNRKEAQE